MKHCTVWLRDLDINKIEAEIFDTVRNVTLEENGKDKVANESN
jgi:hypothetical protein